MAANAPRGDRSVRTRITMTVLPRLGLFLVVALPATYLAVRAAPSPRVALPAGLAVLGVAVLVVAGLAVWRAAGRTTRRVERLGTALREATTADLGRRMPVPPRPRDGDEVDRLAAAVNRTLDRLERAVEYERRFASDASHELRTPLTGLRTRIEFALADREENDPWQTLRDVLKDADRIQAIVEDLHMLSLLDSGHRPRRDRVDLSALTSAVLSASPTRVPVCTDIALGVAVQGDPFQLRALVTNLLTNAERHAKSAVSITVAAGEDAAVLEVTDDGGGIAPADRERVFMRFTRLDTARSRDQGGTGLGLSIARDIASAHDGQLRIEDPVNGQGARLVLRLPLAAERASITS
ncbi:sensor histidine kinase [Spongiactinospora sp. 9N601]|uniref:sensor histidine kinase n=1 Tax=Spongiactinospora sp. 9N601 TaxID=3375149 RepID=UPI003793E892